MKELTVEIKKLKKEKEAVIYAHNYQIDEVQEIADFVGDSLELARRASETQAKVIVLCGVYFMAETAAILNPNKKVLLPDIHSGCPLADMIDAERLKTLKSQNPDIPVVCYVNSSAEVKAESDIACTSSNTVKVVESLKSESVLFVPDRNLGRYIQERTSKKMLIWDGFCPTHDRVTPEEVKLAKAEHPSSLFVAHPECRPEVLRLADEITSTSGMLRFAKKSDSKEFIIGTEMGLIYRLKKENPEKKFYLASQKLICPNMKRNDLHKIYSSLRTMTPQISVEESVRIKAVSSIEKMLAVKSDYD